MKRVVELLQLNRHRFRWMAIGFLSFGLGIWFVTGLRPLGGGLTRFTITPGESRLSVATRLQDQKIVRSRSHFIVASYIGRRSLIAGTFTLGGDWSVSRITATLTSKTKTEQRITIPEGWRREQIAYFLQNKGVNVTQFLNLTTELEGTLFPDTYFIAAEPNVEDVVAKMTNNYKNKTAGMNLTSAQLIIASIVEREAKNDSDRPLIAGIYLGRMTDRMPLEADPTVQYGRDTILLAQGIVPNPFWGPITRSDYQGIVSNYNTYKITGLPPGPIANPGLKSIEAVQHPGQTVARYFFHTKDGNIVTSRTLEEHNRNKSHYLK